jgi:hypothetical protein
MREGESAFPDKPIVRSPGTADEVVLWPSDYGRGGMSLLDWYAGQALNGLLSNSHVVGTKFDTEDVVKAAWDAAESMMELREDQERQRRFWEAQEKGRKESQA